MRKRASPNFLQRFSNYLVYIALLLAACLFIHCMMLLPGNKWATWAIYWCLGSLAVLLLFRGITSSYADKQGIHPEWLQSCKKIILVALSPLLILSIVPALPACIFLLSAFAVSLRDGIQNFYGLLIMLAGTGLVYLAHLYFKKSAGAAPCKNVSS